jgi:DNA polymerase-1
MRLAIIDGSSLLTKSYHGLSELYSKDKKPIGIFTGLMEFIISLNKDIQFDRVLFTFDSDEACYKRDIYPHYKEKKNTSNSDFISQITIAKNWIEQMGFYSVQVSGFESNDIIASILKQYKKSNDITIISHDKRTYQFIEPNVILWDNIKKEIINKSKCVEKYGIYPFQFIDYQAIVGDSAYNINGVKGIGKVTASKLLNKFASLDGIYHNINSLNPNDANKFIKHKEDAITSKALVNFNSDCFLLESLDRAVFPKYNPVLKIANELIKHDMVSFIQRVLDKGLYFNCETPKGCNISMASDIELINNKAKKRTGKFDAILLDSKEKLFDVINTIPKDSLVAFDTETDSIDSYSAELVGYSFCFNEVEAYYVPLLHNCFSEQVDFDDAKEGLEKIISKTKRFIFQNYKYDYEVINNNFGIIMPLHHDTMILSWLYEQNDAYGMDKQVYNLFGKKTIAFKDIVDLKNGETFADVELKEATLYASEDAYWTLKLYLYYKDKAIGKREYIFDYATVYEYPFIECIKQLESNGITLDKEYMLELKKETKDNIEELKNKIFNSTGYEFNISSTTQLSTVLYEYLGLSTVGVKKTTTGYSTKEIYLHNKIAEHDSIKYILEYKKATKLYDTYIIPLLEKLNDDDSNIIRANFLQTGTATGRLSSKNPNLQNIPVRTEDGKRIRNAFVARDGYVLASFDYSQIELRLLAHFSQDSKMVEAYNRGEDLHLKTAIDIFGKENALKKRDIAKTINFGIIYGMGAKKLSQDLDISHKDAKNYMEQYFSSFPTVDDYINKLKKQAVELGYIESLIGRRRWFNLSNAKNKGHYLALLREAVNTKFQASASDIIKVASSNIAKDIKDNNEINILVQIHDELLFEIREDKIEHYKKYIINEMKNSVKLTVPLEVSSEYAYRWGDAK